ncbi:MAG: phosphoribosylformylglycinamidine synthase subunit PurL [Clostridia bacterium]|nr:phosphoribosylformylglycinamidine synthase subunit PurL [Clostridia bacterium]
MTARTTPVQGRPEPVAEGAARAAAVGLTGDEYARVVSLLGRAPNDVELGLFGGLWSEHCSYKSSRRHLGALPKDGPGVVAGPGENAGVVRLSPRVSLALRIESHNHPSAVEPYQGAATGVGGIIRDVASSGARPVALLDGLRFGPPSHARALGHFRGVVAGVGGYGNCIGVPTVGGETEFEPGFAENPLVNVMCLGYLPAGRRVRPVLGAPGSAVLLLGAPTGRDGVHGASLLASRGLVPEDDQRPAVQVGDPFHGKRLLEASLALVEAGVLLGLTDLGAAGLASALAEAAARQGVGVDVWLERVPLREAGLTPYEILLSETQERMLCAVRLDDVARARAVARREGVEAAEIGRVTETGRLRAFFREAVVADVPVAALTEAAPVYDRPARDEGRGRAADGPLPPAGAAGAARAGGREVPSDADLTGRLRAFLSSPWLASRRPVYRTYDFEVQTNTVVPPGRDAAVLRVRGEADGVALALAGESRYGRLDPRYGGLWAFAQALRSLACLGARPLAAVDCLNFASPERPEVMGSFRAAVAGLAEAARALKTPVVGGNVSFYNETDGRPIPPTPVVGAVGRVPEVAAARARLLPESLSGWEVWLLGAQAASLAASAFQFFSGGVPHGALPPFDLALERRVAILVRQAVRQGRAVATDVGKGGLAPALFRLTGAAREAAGADCDLPLGAAGEGCHDALTALFGEGPSRVLVATDEPGARWLARAASRLRVPLLRLGRLSAGDAFRIRVRGPHGRVVAFVDAPRSELARAWEGGLEGGDGAVA